MLSVPAGAEENMGQRTSGVRSLLSSPWIYRSFQAMVGSHRARKEFAEQFVRAQVGDAVLDVGCGPADILEELPEVDYVGFDPSPDYVASARDRYGNRAKFFVSTVNELVPDRLDTFDLIMAKGVLHHLDDREAIRLFEAANELLRPGGRLVTLDGAFAEGQSRIARAALKRDRGENVRTETAYRTLAEEVFPDVQSHLRHDLLRIPYTHAVLECRRANS